MYTMKKIIIILSLISFCTYLNAQDSGEQKEWLLEFSAVKIKAPSSVQFIEVADSVAPYVVYDKKGSYTSKFELEVKNKTLYITEREESRRTTQTEVTVYYHNLNNIDIQSAKVNFKSPLRAVMVNISVGLGADVTIPLEVQDSKIEVTGKSKLTLTGRSKYMMLYASTADFNASNLECTSVIAKATTGANVLLNVSERVEASTSTKAKITYRGNPQIIRGNVSFLGGEIIKNN